MDEISSFTHKIIDAHLSPEIGLKVEDYLWRGDAVGATHLLRYYFACNVLNARKPDRVIDIGCGDGYGSFLLASTNPHIEVVGADHNENAILNAKFKYNLSNLIFSIGDIRRWDFGMFDCVVSFDTLEHVNHRDIMMMQIVNHLNDNGFLLLSTPCVKTEQSRFRPKWIYHKIEYSKNELYDFLSRYFRKVNIPEDGSMIFSIEVKKVNRRYHYRMNPVLCEKPIKIAGVF